MGRIWRLYESDIHLGSLRVKGGERAMVMGGMGIRVESRMPSSQIGAIIMKDQVERERERELTGQVRAGMIQGKVIANTYKL